MNREVTIMGIFSALFGKKKPVFDEFFLQEKSIHQYLKQKDSESIERGTYLLIDYLKSEYKNLTQAELLISFKVLMGWLDHFYHDKLSTNQEVLIALKRLFDKGRLVCLGNEKEFAFLHQNILYYIKYYIGDEQFAEIWKISNVVPEIVKRETIFTILNANFESIKSMASITSFDDDLMGIYYTTLMADDEASVKQSKNITFDMLEEQGFRNIPDQHVGLLREMLAAHYQNEDKFSLDVFKKDLDATFLVLFSPIKDADSLEAIISIGLLVDALKKNEADIDTQLLQNCFWDILENGTSEKLPAFYYLLKTMDAWHNKQ